MLVMTFEYAYENDKDNDMSSENIDKAEEKLVPTAKSIVVNPDQSDYIDNSIVNRKFYNAFNYSMLPDEYQKINLTVGVTSPNKGEGKTLTASNLAVSLALAYKKKTVLIDLNLKDPSLHSIFGTSLKPGLVESFQNGSVYLSQTKLDQLYLLPAGEYRDFSLDMNDVISIRDIVYSLKKEFEFVILDMNSIFPVEDFPAIFAKEFDGLLVVIDTESTKYADVEKIFRHINKNQTMGFVFNKVDDHS